MNRPACLGSHTEEFWKAEWSAGLWSLAFCLNECKLTKTKLLKVNIHLFFLVSEQNINCIRKMQLLQQVRVELAHHSHRHRTASGRCLPGKQPLLKNKVCVGAERHTGDGFVSLPACVCRVHKCLHPRLPSCSVAAVSVAARAMEPHRGQPCKEHKRPI